MVQLLHRTPFYKDESETGTNGTPVHIDSCRFTLTDFFRPYLSRQLVVGPVLYLRVFKFENESTTTVDFSYQKNQNVREKT